MKITERHESFSCLETGEKGRGKFTQDKIGCWTSPCWWKQCRSGEAGEFLFLLLLFLTSDTLVASKALSPHPHPSPQSISAPGLGELSPGPHWPPQPHCSLLKKASPESCFKKSLLPPLKNPSISGEIIMEALEPLQLFTSLIALNIGCKCWKSQI